MYSVRTTKGMSLVELLVAIALISLVFGAIMASFQVVASLIGSSKAYAGAISLANERIEYIRSLPYNSIGTIAGIPEGPIPQTGTTTINGREYLERVVIEYIDDDADGTGASDTNGILADYKRIKVEYSWDENGKTKIVSLISNIVPRGIETTAGGGTLVVNVFDAAVQPLQGAEVRIYNDTGTTTIDTVRYTNASGIAMFAGAPALANYQITVTDTGYSTDQTYSATTSNPNPTTPHVAVLESQVSTMNFQIDALSDLTVVTIGVPTTGEYTEAFDDLSGIETSNNVQLSGGTITLAGTPGTYAASGDMRSIGYAPADFDTWDVLLVDANVPANTSAVIQLYDASSSTNPQLIPDSDLPGNAVGFVTPVIPLSLQGSEYPVLSVGAQLSTSDSATTSRILSWELGYTEEKPTIGNVPLALRSLKTIGFDGASQSIPKYEGTFTTNVGGEISISDIEWGGYEIDVTDPSYDIAEACEDIPYSLDPGVSETLELTLVPAVTHSLRVRVEDISGDPVPNAEVTLSRGGFIETAETSLCGQHFFNSGIGEYTDYALEITAPGFVTHSATDVAISGATTLVVTLSE